MSEPIPKLDQQIAFCSELALLKHKAMTLGLFRTMHKLDFAVKEVGFETAELIEQNRALYKRLGR